MTIHEAVKSYFEPKISEISGGNLNYNFSPENPDEFSLITNYADKTVKKYINGDCQKAYGFTIIIVKQYSTSGDDLNLECMNFVQEFMDWIEEQNRKRVFPDLGEKCEVEKIEVLQNMPNLAGVNAEHGLSRYMIQAKILYRKYAD